MHCMVVTFELFINVFVSKYTRNLLRMTKLQIILCWVPSHIDIPENEAAYQAAKYAVHLSITEMGIHHEDYKLHIKNCIDRLW